MLTHNSGAGFTRVSYLRGQVKQGEFLTRGKNIFGEKAGRGNLPVKTKRQTRFSSH